MSILSVINQPTVSTCALKDKVWTSKGAYLINDGILSIEVPADTFTSVTLAGVTKKIG